MTTPRSGDHADGPGLPGEPYPGGRAQAESGSKIIESDYYAWKAVRIEPNRLRLDHPVLLQFTQAWHAVSTLGLGDDAGAASIRYRVLAHAAWSLVPAGGGREAQALQRLWRHASVHGQRLYATWVDQFLGSGASGRYAGYEEAAAESANIDKRYQPLAAHDRAGELRQAWAGIEKHGLTDGPVAAAERYQALAGHARGICDDTTQRLPSAVISSLLELAMYADMHAIRLHSTAAAIKGETPNQPEPYRGLPTQVAAAAIHGHAEVPHGGQATIAATRPAARSIRKQDQQRDR
jgi:hypothetical protein